MLTSSSLSEYGCNHATRKFEEVASLYSSNMSPVYSGGLVYEYSQESSNYGLVNIESDTSVSPRPDFSALQSALAGTKPPSGDGGAKSSGEPSDCPAQSPTWDVDTNELPIMPSPAAKYMQNGAGQPQGLSGKGSQSGGTASSGFSNSDGSSSSSSASPSGSKGAAAAVSPSLGMTPLVCAGATLFSIFVGAAALL